MDPVEFAVWETMATNEVDYALEHGKERGIWGGTSVRARRAMRRGQRAA